MNSLNWYESDSGLQYVFENSDVPSSIDTEKDLNKWIERLELYDGKIDDQSLKVFIKYLEVNHKKLLMIALERLKTLMNKLSTTGHFEREVENREKKQVEKKAIQYEEYDAYEVCDLILSVHEIKTLGTRRPEYCVYTNGVYKRNQIRTVKTIISDTLRELNIKYSLTKSNELLELIANETSIGIEEFDKKKSILNVENGLLDLNTLELKPHTPEYYSFRRIPVKYDPDAKCPNNRKFLKEVFYSKDIRYILEKIGLTLTSIVKFQDGTFLFGTGNNGKTTFYNVLRKLTGLDNCSAVDLYKYDGFEFSKIENKLANILSDIDSSHKINIQNYKLYVGNEMIVPINRKFKEPYDIPPTANNWYSCNTTFPQVPIDTDKGFWRKVTIIECPNEFDFEEDPDLLEKLITPDELSGLLNLAIKNLRTLIRRKRFFPRYYDWEYYKDFWLTKNNEFGQFAEEKALIGKKYYANKQETLKRLNSWLIGKGKSPISDTKLTHMIKGLPKFYHERLSINGKQTWVYTGFTFEDQKTKLPDFYLQKRIKKREEDNV